VGPADHTSEREDSASERGHKRSSIGPNRDLVDKVSMHNEIADDGPRDNGAHGRVNSGQVADCIANRDIASFVDKVSIHYEIANPESPT
jgi:hypothetical protein